jgi:hypothetical protein
LSSVLCGFCGFVSGAGRPLTCAATAAVATVDESRATTNGRIGDIDVRSGVWAEAIRGAHDSIVRARIAQARRD